MIADRGDKIGPLWDLWTEAHDSPDLMPDFPQSIDD